jgi:hypothetical protein
MPDRMEPREHHCQPAPSAKQVDILFDALTYTAFPHVIPVGGDELLMAFRQAPQEEGVHHTHPRSVITVMRSYDAGRTWDAAAASQLAAGGGQECALIHLGGGRVGAAIAWHEIAPVREQERWGFPRPFPNEYPCRTPGTFWAWSETLGLAWRPDHVRFLAPDIVPCGPIHRCRDGRILVPAYAFPGSAKEYDPGSMSSVLLVSTDEGQRWSAPLEMARGAPGVRGFCEPAAVETRPGVLRALHRVETRTSGPDCCFWANESLDGGRTWTAPEPTGILSGACPRLLPLADGRLLLTFGRRFPPFGIRAMISEDGGANWGDTAWILREAKNGNQGYTSAVELDGGRMFTATYTENAKGVTGLVGTFWRLPS